MVEQQEGNSSREEEEQEEELLTLTADQEHSRFLISDDPHQHQHIKKMI